MDNQQLEETLATLSARIGDAVDVQRKRITLLTRWLFAFAAVACIATVLAVVSHVRVNGTVSDLNRQVLAGCASDRDIAGLPVLSLQVAASRSPGVRPTVPPITQRIADNAALAYMRAGCEAEYGPLPTFSPPPPPSAPAG